ncbi:CRISPR-associated endonuclease Cas2 [[Mycoplasma] cavipharyngis]|uniref:CRISPR-associated endonuclease Cas2 n=1 Tax=[Mycoplasma] cavipharyngis TaxID=92757 RepID=UPI003704694D
MRLVLFYDLPFDTEKNRKVYTRFHKWITKRGYLMLQFSVYYKTIPATQKYSIELQAIKNNAPRLGNVRLLKVSEKQFIDMDIICGELSINEKYNGAERYIRIDNDLEE